MWSGAPVSKPFVMSNSIQTAVSLGAQTLVIPLVTNLVPKGNQMDKDRIKGAANQAKGAAKEAAGKLLGDPKLRADGKTGKAVGKVQSAVGGLKDTLRGE